MIIDQNNYIFMNKLMGCNDFLFIQEHWLRNDDLSC